VLLQIARKSVETAVKEHKLYECSAGGLERLEEARGAFVTLKERGELRGCIGYMTPVKPLCLTVRDVAALAAVEDRRFTPVTVAELSQLEYEISVLSPMRRVMDIQEIKVGKHGLLIKKGEQEGVLLPQVPTEQGWDRKTFLEEVCLKAGLPRQTWQDEDADLFLFSALVFSEHSLAEPLTEEEPGIPKQRVPPTRLGPDSPQP
jgi:AmmeMemoRadiSam system protein A